MNPKMENPFESIMNELADIKSALSRLQSTTTIASMPTGRKPLKIKEAADYLGLAETSMYPLVSSGKIKASKPGKHLMFTKECLDNYLSGNSKRQGDPTEFLLVNKKRLP